MERQEAREGTACPATVFIVMELVDGEDLSTQIARGPMALADTLPIARQIADALESAHEQGVVHRDLKPANIKVRADGTVKVLDFGLAKAMGTAKAAPYVPDEGSYGGRPFRGADPDLPTITTPAMTQAGMILGTAAYMSPEQARGKNVDKRADIWAFGCVLFEMLTGARAFGGDDITDTIVAVVSKEPDWQALPTAASGARPLLTRCLKKDPKARMRDIGEARLHMDDVLSGTREDVVATGESAPVTPRRVAWLPVVVALASVALFAALATWIVMRPPPQAPIVSSRFAIVSPPAPPLDVSPFYRDFALSPDGRYLVFRTGGEANGGPLMLRAIDQLDAQPLAGITNARDPFFSSDSRVE
jgi:serine/threonine-protein kinase